MHDNQFDQIKDLMERHRDDYLENREAVNKLIAETIRTTVNGKIDALTKNVTELRQEVKPAVNLVLNLRGFNKVLLYIIGVVSLVAGAAVAVTQLFSQTPK